MIEISIWIAILRHKYMKFPSLFIFFQKFFMARSLGLRTRGLRTLSFNPIKSLLFIGFQQTIAIKVHNENLLLLCVVTILIKDLFCALGARVWNHYGQKIANIRIILNNFFTIADIPILRPDFKTTWKILSFKV